jgi:hypothetical protein
MARYNLPCDEATVNCILFPKDLFQGVQSNLRRMVNTRPGTVEARIRWIRNIIGQIRAALAHTNIIDTWLLGDWAPIDILNEPSSRQKINTLDSALWTRGHEAAWSLSRKAADDPRSPRSTVFWPLTSPASDGGQGFTRYDPFAAFSGSPTDAYGYVVSPSRRAPVRFFMFHAPYDFIAPVASGVSGARGLGIMEASGSGRPTLDNLAISSRVRQALAAENFNLKMPAGDYPEYYAAQEYILRKHFLLHSGAELVPAYQVYPPSSPKVGQRFTHFQPSAEYLMNYYAAIANDIIDTPYEIYVLWGLQKWAENLAVWSQRGRINISTDQIVSFAREVSTARTRVFSAGGFAIGAGIASAINPIAGAVLMALGTLSDLLFREAGAVGYWNCPYPLTRRSAAGDCDFGTVIGPDALERAREQREGIEQLMSDRLLAPPPPPPPAETRAGVPPILLVGGGLAVAAALGYYLLKE